MLNSYASLTGLETASSASTCDELRLSETGDHLVDVPLVCVLTRFHLRNMRDLLPSFRDYRRVLSEARRTPGLLRAVFLVENLKTWYSLSIWESYDAIPLFGTCVQSHVEAARRGFGRVSFQNGRGPEIWSTKWHLAAVSNNLNWADFDLRGVIMRVYAQREGSWVDNET